MRRPKPKRRSYRLYLSKHDGVALLRLPASWARRYPPGTPLICFKHVLDGLMCLEAPSAYERFDKHLRRRADSGLIQNKRLLRMLDASKVETVIDANGVPLPDWFPVDADSRQEFFGIDFGDHFCVWKIERLAEVLEKYSHWE